MPNQHRFQTNMKGFIRITVFVTLDEKKEKMAVKTWSWGYHVHLTM